MKWNGCETLCSFVLDVAQNQMQSFKLNIRLHDDENKYSQP